MSRESFVFCVACNHPVALPRGALVVECDCGMQYRGLTGQPVEEPICGLPATPPARSSAQ